MKSKQKTIFFAFVGVLMVLSVLYIFNAVINVNAKTGEASGKKPEAKPVENKVIAQGLTVPWEMVFLPNGDYLITQRPGTLKRIGHLNKTQKISDVHAIGEGGLLGMALDPDFESSPLIFLYRTVLKNGQVQNEVVRYTYSREGNLHNPVVILEGIPGGTIHNGGRIKFGPDGYLYVTTGDAGHASLAQDKESLAGKILRITKNGEAVSGNPFDTKIYSYGHRNPQGLAWDNKGRLWATEHGPNRHDELNLIESGNNYGWPLVRGDQALSGMVKPILHSGSEDTWAPSGLAYFNGDLFFGGLRGQALYRAKINPDTPEVTDFSTHLKGKYGRIRNVIKGPNGFLYLMTSNKDGRGTPDAVDDRLIKIEPASLSN